MLDDNHRRPAALPPQLPVRHPRHLEKVAKAEACTEAAATTAAFSTPSPLSLPGLQPLAWRKGGVRKREEGKQDGHANRSGSISTSPSFTAIVVLRCRTPPFLPILPDLGSLQCREAAKLALEEAAVDVHLLLILRHKDVGAFELELKEATANTPPPWSPTQGCDR
ncbi:hypothetical protein OsJ_27526 [Oryza sativa Japonica Group]|uniref:Uncharacterized protein n=1 Tax=Oryza sativa subsp. japonica TaxID=39947 RepID=A3BTP8_ORYSJ|nr:hypothetical protein OsJ_27526 [Oryza sativa Japonica Group]